MINVLLMGVSAVVVVIALIIMYQRAKLRTAEIIEDDYSTIDSILEAVKNEMVDIVKEDYSLGLNDTDFNLLYKRKARIQDALRNAVHGIDSAKVIVQELIREFINKNVPKDRVQELLGLSDGMQPSDHVMFEILMYRLKKVYGKQALSEMIRKYDLDRERLATGAEKQVDTAYYITVEDLHSIYDQEDIHLSESEQVEVLSVLVYQLYKGFGILDTLREMDINGFNCGTSGSIMSNVAVHREGALRATNSVWLYFQGKYIHLRFMSFGSEDELKRIIQLMIRYNNPGALTAKRGYLVNTMYDKSRILALRPPASEYWAVFVRKFTISDPSPKALISKSYTKRADLPIRIIEFLMRGMVTSAITGRQGSGKTTLTSSIIRYIDSRYTIRIMELAPELYLRELYPSRNILSVQETDTVSAAALQDALKKSDAAVSIVGEVASDIIAARMIQLGQVASLFTIFSHHANTAKDLVHALRNSLVNAGGFSDMYTAEKQVTDVIKIDVHLDYSASGERYIDRISEIVPLEEGVEYPDYDVDDPLHSMNRITKEYYTRQTDRQSFITRDILRYDDQTKTYYIVNRFSPQLETYIRKNLGSELKLEFDKFTLLEWGQRESGVDEVAEALLEYYKDYDFNTPSYKQEPDASDVDQGTGLTVEEGESSINLDTIISHIKEDSVQKDTIQDDDDLDDKAEQMEETALFFDFFEGGVNI